MNSNETGIIFSATGEHYVGEALEALQVSMRHNRCPHAVFCSPSPTNRLDGVLYLSFTTSGHPKVDKLRNMAKSPFEKTIYLDSDVHVCSEITDLTDLLGAYDIAAAHAPGYRGLADPEIPDAFFELNTGVVAYVRKPEVCAMLHDAASLCQTWATDPPTFYRGSPAVDQPVFRRCLWRTNLKLYVLGPEYNYRSTKPGFVVDEVRVVHGRHDDMEAIAETLNKKSQAVAGQRMRLPRVFPAFPVASWAGDHNARWRKKPA